MAPWKASVRVESCEDEGCRRFVRVEEARGSRSVLRGRRSMSVRVEEAGGLEEAGEVFISSRADSGDCETLCGFETCTSSWSACLRVVTLDD